MTTSREVREKFREACLQGYESVRERQRAIEPFKEVVREANAVVQITLGHAPKCPLLFEEGVDSPDGRTKLVAGGLVLGVFERRRGHLVVSTADEFRKGTKSGDLVTIEMFADHVASLLRSPPILWMMETGVYDPCLSERKEPT